MRLEQIRKSLTEISVTEAFSLISNIRFFRRTYYQTGSKEARRVTSGASSKAAEREKKRAAKAELNAAQARELLTRLGIT